MTALVDAWKDGYQGLQDMLFLYKEIYPQLKNKIVAFDAYCCSKFDMKSIPFPTKRLPNFEHIGHVKVPYVS